MISLYTYLIVYQMPDIDGKLVVQTMNGICFSPTPALVEERATLYAASKFGGGKLISSSVCKQDMRSHLRSLLNMLWINYRPRLSKGKL